MDSFRTMHRQGTKGINAFRVKLLLRHWETRCGIIETHWIASARSITWQRASLCSAFQINSSTNSAFLRPQSSEPMASNCGGTLRARVEFSKCTRRCNGSHRKSRLRRRKLACMTPRPTLRRRTRRGDLNAMTSIYKTVNTGMLAFPSHPIPPEKLPLTVDLGGLSIILESHPGHSGTDLIVRVPSQNVVYTGDLIFNGWYPVTFDPSATVSGWRDTLRKFASYDKDTIFVPGHGQLCGQEGVATLRAVFDDISEQAEKMHKAGVPAKEAADRYVVPEKYKNFPIFGWGLTIGPAITKLYAEWGTK